MDFSKLNFLAVLFLFCLTANAAVFPVLEQQESITLPVNDVSIIVMEEDVLIVNSNDSNDFINLIEVTSSGGTVVASTSCPSDFSCSMDLSNLENGSYNVLVTTSNDNTSLQTIHLD